MYKDDGQEGHGCLSGEDCMRVHLFHRRGVDEPPRAFSPNLSIDFISSLAGYNVSISTWSKAFDKQKSVVRLWSITFT